MRSHDHRSESAVTGRTRLVATGSQEGSRCPAREPRIVPDRRPPGGLGDRDAGRLRMLLDSDASAPGRARMAIRGWSEKMLVEPFRRDALELLVSELVTNAVRHAVGSRAAPIDLAASCEAEEILVTVADGGIGSLPRMGSARGERGGYGLRILDRESTRWGVRRETGTSVWFAI